MRAEFDRDHYFMARAYALAESAREQSEVPVGAVLVLNDSVVSAGHNAPIQSSDPCAHAEVLALRRYAKKIGNYRLPFTTLYVTLEPCLMCAGAILHARVQRLVFAAHDPRTGAVESVFQVFDNPSLNHQVDYQGGVMAEPCAQILKDFFREKR